MYFVAWISGFGFGDLFKKANEKRKRKKRKKKYIAYGGLILFYHRGKGPRGNPRDFFSRFVMGNPMNLYMIFR